MWPDQDALRNALTSRLFMRGVVENRLRGDLVEELVRIKLEPKGWRHCGADWKSWDFEHPGRKLKIQVKQSARQQTWGPSLVASRYGIAAVSGFYEGNVWRQLDFPQRLSEIYVFAHHPIEGE